MTHFYQFIICVVIGAMAIPIMEFSKLIEARRKYWEERTRSLKLKNYAEKL